MATCNMQYALCIVVQRSKYTRVCWALFVHFSVLPASYSSLVVSVILANSLDATLCSVHTTNERETMTHIKKKTYRSFWAFCIHNTRLFISQSANVSMLLLLFLFMFFHSVVLLFFRSPFFTAVDWFLLIFSMHMSNAQSFD